jgi:hypothetical protein
MSQIYYQKSNHQHKHKHKKTNMKLLQKQTFTITGSKHKKHLLLHKMYGTINKQKHLQKQFQNQRNMPEKPCTPCIQKH